MGGRGGRISEQSVFLVSMGFSLSVRYLVFLFSESEDCKHISMKVAVT